MEQRGLHGHLPERERFAEVRRDVRDGALHDASVEGFGLWFHDGESRSWSPHRT